MAPRKTKKSKAANKKDRREVLEAIKYADKYAGDDDAQYLRALNARYHASALKKLPKGGRARLKVERGRGAAPDTSFHIYDDPRYLKNARELAKQSKGGLRVIGGTDVPAGLFLHCVAVGSDSQWACTGTLIGPNVVLTAGHCASFATRVFFGSDVSKKGTIVRVKKRVRHPQYHKKKHNDLLVLVLETPVKTVKACKLASQVVINKMKSGRVVGFGNNDPMGMFGYGVKRQVDVPVASPACSGKVNGSTDAMSYGCDVGLEIVAGRPLLERDSCKGDSGGPFYVQYKKQWLLAGATSRATDSAVHTCGDGGIYARVDKYRSWIAGIPGVQLA